MTRLWLWMLVAIVPAAIVVAAVWSPDVAPQAVGTSTSEEPAAASPRRPGLPLGMAGCTAAACHGAPADTMLRDGPTANVWECAATYWLAVDPHTQAYAALESNLANRMMIHLNGEKAPGQPNVRATEDVRCLACHTNPSLAKPDTPFASLRSEGVGCEACHGDSSGWLHGHTTWSVQKAVSGYEQTGMVKLYDIGERAIVCAGCHVGAPADFPVKGYPVRDMNHDMIAAGHPRLNFDFADYQHSLPPHWLERDRATQQVRGPDFEITMWLVGRFAHAEAACRLLEDRAKRAEANDPRTPWPEYAEYQCVSCHHSLGRRYPPPASGSLRRPGSPRWQALWPVDAILTLEITMHFAGAGNTGLYHAIEQPVPKTDLVISAATNLADQLKKYRQRLASDPAQVQSTVKQLMKVAASEDLDRIDRDFAEQLYHAFAAGERERLRRAAQAGQPVKPNETLESLRNCVLLPRGNLTFDIPPCARTDLKELLK